MHNHNNNVISLLSGIQIPDWLQVNDYYDTSDWPNCYMGCTGDGIINENLCSCSWCTYLTKKGSCENLKELVFRIPAKYEEGIKSALLGISYTSTPIFYKEKTRLSFYTNTNFHQLKNLLQSMKSDLSDTQIAELDLGNVELGEWRERDKSEYGKGLQFNVKVSTEGVRDLVKKLIDIIA